MAGDAELLTNPPNPRTGAWEPETGKIAGVLSNGTSGIGYNKGCEKAFPGT